MSNLGRDLASQWPTPAKLPPEFRTKSAAKPEKAKPEPVKKVAPAAAKVERNPPVRGKYTVDSAIPIPAKTSGQTRLVYPYARLAVGDSFFVPKKTYAVTNRMPNKKFISRPWTQDGKEGRRIWRIK